VARPLRRKGRDRRVCQLEALVRLASRVNNHLTALKPTRYTAILRVLLFIDVHEPKHAYAYKKQPQTTHEIEQQLNCHQSLFHAILRSVKGSHPFSLLPTEIPKHFRAPTFDAAVENSN
jgi:hypothetical protein